MEDICVQKLKTIKTTKSDHKIIYAIGCLTLQEKKRATKTTHALIAQYCGCSEKTVQRSVAKLEKAKLITRGRPKWKKSAWFINISLDFYQETKTIFHEQKKLSTQAQNVHTGRTIILKNSNTSSSQSHLQKITKTEIKNSRLEFFISESIGKLDLKNLDSEIGLTFSDLEGIFRKVGWQARDIQYSIDNFSLALKTKTFSPTKLSAREAFISILTGSNKKLPSLFNKPQELLKAEKNECVKVIQESAKKSIESKIQTANENYWLSLPIEQKNEFLLSSDGQLKEAMARAMTKKVSDELKTLMNQSLKNDVEIIALKNEKRLSFTLSESLLVQNSRNYGTVTNNAKKYENLNPRLIPKRTIKDSLKIYQLRKIISKKVNLPNTLNNQTI